MDRPRHDPASVAGLSLLLAAGMFGLVVLRDVALAVLDRPAPAPAPLVRAADTAPSVLWEGVETRECPCRFCGCSPPQGTIRVTDGLSEPQGTITVVEPSLVEWDTPPTGVYVRDGDRWVRWEDRGR